MIAYFIRRFLYMAIILIITSVTAFIIINLPPGDWLTSHIAELESSGYDINNAEIASLKKQYGLDLPPYAQYFKWVSGMFKGDFGKSFSYNRPVKDLLIERLPLTIAISLCAIILTYVLAIPIGIYSATKQYSLGDYIFTIFGFIGLAIPNFLLALVIMYFSHKYFGLSIGGLFSAEYIGTSWSLDKVIDLLKHLPVPLVVIGLAGTAKLIRVMRGTLLDEIGKQYVITARTKGLSERRLLFKYPVRIALNPVISTIGWILPSIFSGATIVSIVLNLPTTGPLLYNALVTQDMYLAGSIVMFLTFLTVIGTFLSDIMLGLVDPRIKIAD